MHPISTIINTWGFFIHPAKDNILTPEKVKQICKELHSDETKELTAKQIDDMEKTLLYILERVSDLSQKMKIGHVDVCLLPDAFGASSFKGYNFQILRLEPTFFNHCAQKTIDDTLAHELAHCKHNDTPKGLALNWLVSLVYIACFRRFKFRHFLAAMMLTKGISSILFSYKDKKIELAADREGWRYLNSSEGAIQHYHSLLKNNYRIKHAPAEELLKLNPNNTLDKIETAKALVTPEGNVSLSPTHPPLTECLAQALAFKPDTSS